MHVLHITIFTKLKEGEVSFESLAFLVFNNGLASLNRNTNSFR